jgi:hypothetical protein
LQGCVRALRDLGLALYTRHLRTQNRSDLDRTIVTFAAAIAVIGDREDNGLTAFLDSALKDRFEGEGGVESDVAFEEMGRIVKKFAIQGEDRVVFGILAGRMSIQGRKSSCGTVESEIESPN